MEQVNGLLSNALKQSKNQVRRNQALHYQEGFFFWFTDDHNA